MEFLDMLVGVFGGCVGLLEVLTVLLDAAAGFVSVKTYQKYKHAAEKSVGGAASPICRLLHLRNTLI